MAFFIQLTINGVMLGALYAAMTLGFSVVWGVMRLINLAYGEFVMLGAYIAWVLANPLRTEVGIRIGSQTITAVSLVLISTWLALGLVISQFVLSGRIRQPIVRRMVGYGSSAAIVSGVGALWAGAKYPAFDPFLSIPVVMVIGFSLGYVLQRGIFNRIIESSYLTVLLVTFGISIILSNVVLRVFSANPLTIRLSYENAIALGDNITFSPIRVFVFVLSLVMMALMVAFIQYTQTGRAIRAAAQNKMTARLVGINVNATYAITFALCIAITAATGAMFAGFSTIVPTFGQPLTLRAFSITALGGLGKIEGAVVGGLVRGLGGSYVGGSMNTGGQGAT